MRGDWLLAGPSLASGDDLQTAILISLFTDRLAAASDQTPDGDRRGWWGDDPHHLMGSRLWLLGRVKGPQDVAKRAHDYAAEALQWLIDDQVVARFDINAQWIARSRLNLIVTAYRQDGSHVALKFDNVWAQ